MLYYSYFNRATIFKKFNTYVQYNFCMHMSQVTSSHFAKYFCDIYSKYITPCTVIIYATSDAIQVTPLRLHTLRSGAPVVCATSIVC
jgi:hypothetical protein